MRKRTVPRCLGANCDNPARKDSFFCSDRCGNSWAEGYIGCGEVSYCARCQQGYFDTDNPYPCLTCDYDPRKPEEDDEDENRL